MMIFDPTSKNELPSLIFPRSNNAVEGWHNVFANRVAISHPTVEKLTEKIRLEQSKFEIDIARHLQGHQPKPRKSFLS